MAVIKNHKTGMWEVRTYYKDLIGARKQKTKRGFAKKSEALEWERNFKLKEDQSISMSFKSFVDIYLTDLEPRIKRNTFLTKKHYKDETGYSKYFKYAMQKKGVEIVEAEICPDHVHMLVKIPPSLSVSSFVGYLKGKSTLMIFERHANLKYKYGNRHFWCRGYYVDTVGKNAKKIQEYIQNQLQNDLEYD